MTLTIGSLFAGYGGLDLAVETALGARTAWVSEIEPGACKVLAHRFPTAPNLGDITLIDWATVPPVDVITGGSPCQDLSTAGRRRGMNDGTRSNLWVLMREAIAQLQPQFVVWENVRGALSADAASALEPCPGCVGDEPDEPTLRALGRVLGDLAELGFDAEWRSLRASDVGACHQRFRVFVLAWRPGAVAPSRPLKVATPTLLTSALLLPTPLAGIADHDGAYAREDYHYNLGEWVGHFEAGSLAATLPTPTRATRGGSATETVALLPTPSASVANDGEGPETWLERRERVKLTAANGNGMGMPLTIAVQLLPTPTVGHRDRSESTGLSKLDGTRDFVDLGSVAALTRFGQYAPAIARQELAFGYPAPNPTEPSKNGRPRLSARFAEWMMGAPPGWITDTPGVTRAEALRMAGNGVVWQQALAALLDMLPHIATTPKEELWHSTLLS